MTSLALGNTVNNSYIGSLSHVSDESIKRSLRSRTWALRSGFRFKSAGRRSCLSIPKTRGPELFELPGGAVSVDGAHHCNSVSSCPSCRGRILSKRAKEIQGIIDFFLAGIDVEPDFIESAPHSKTGENLVSFNREVVMLTLTFPHDRLDRLADLLGETKTGQGLRGARSYFFGQSHFYRVLRESLHGAINGIEITFGPNGFHPHVHALLFLDVSRLPDRFRSGAGVNYESLQQFAFEQWSGACSRAGLPGPSQKFGALISPGASAGEYVSKWLGGSELSDSGKKIGRGVNYSLAQMEGFSAFGSGSTWITANVQEYYDQMYGVKIHNFSHSLKKLRGFYHASAVSSIVRRGLGVGSGETSQFLNEAGPQFLNDLPENRGLLNEVMPGFKEFDGQWMIVRPEPESPIKIPPDLAEIFVTHEFIWEYYYSDAEKNRIKDQKRRKDSGRVASRSAENCENFRSVL